MPRTNMPNPASVDTPTSSAARTTSGTGTALTGYGKVTAMRCQLNVTAASGTSPTLDVVIEDTLDGTNWNTVGTFTQATGATRQVINISAPFGDTVRTRWTIGGTSPSFTFAVIIYTQ